MAPRTTDTHTISVRKERDSRGRLGLPTYRLDLPGIKLEMTKTILETRSIYCAHQPLVSIQESNPGRDHKNGMIIKAFSATVSVPDMYSFQKKISSSAGIEPAANGLKVQRSTKLSLEGRGNRARKKILVPRRMFCSFISNITKHVCSAILSAMCRGLT